MSEKMLFWDIYEITNSEESIKGVMLRGRIRKFGIEQNINILTENASDQDNTVRFAVTDKVHSQLVTDFIKTRIRDCVVMLVLESIPNPVLSKLKVNNIDRY